LITMQQAVAVDLPDPSTITTKKPLKQTIPLEYLLDLRKKNLTYEEIGKLCGITKQAVHERVSDAQPGLVRLESFKTHRGDVLANIQMMIANTLDEDEIKKMAARDKVLAFGVLYDKERLETGQSTSHVVMTHELKLDRSRYTDRMLVDAIDVTPEAKT
jgi:predicted transcriptional regulator